MTYNSCYTIKPNQIKPNLNIPGEERDVLLWTTIHGQTGGSKNSYSSYGGIHGVIVTIEKIKTANRVQTLEEAAGISHSTNTFGKYMKSKYSPSTDG